MLTILRIGLCANRQGTHTCRSLASALMADATGDSYQRCRCGSSLPDWERPAVFGVLLPNTSRGTTCKQLKHNLCRLGASLRKTVDRPSLSLRILVAVDNDDPLLGLLLPLD
jgi:hypothetical protein